MVVSCYVFKARFSFLAESCLLRCCRACTIRWASPWAFLWHMEQQLVKAVGAERGDSEPHERRYEQVSADSKPGGMRQLQLAPTPTHFAVDELLPMLPEHLRPRNVVVTRPADIEDVAKRVYYKPTIGLLAKVRTATRRVLGFLKHRHVKCDDFGERECLHLFMQQLLPPSWLSDEAWTQQSLFAASEDLHERCRYLSHKQAVLLDDHPLLKRALSTDNPAANENTGNTFLVFQPWFLQEVEQYHRSLERPNVDVTTITEEVEVVDTADPSPCWPKVLAWSSVRCLCTGCGSKRALYCGKYVTMPTLISPQVAACMLSQRARMYSRPKLCVMTL